MRTPATPTIEALILKLLEDKERDSLLIEKLLQERDNNRKSEIKYLNTV